MWCVGLLVMFETNLVLYCQCLALIFFTGADPLLCLLYETDTNVERENPAVLEDIARVWRYRTPISLQHLRQEVDAKVSQRQHKVLQLFLKEVSQKKKTFYCQFI